MKKTAIMMLLAVCVASAAFADTMPAVPSMTMGTIKSINLGTAPASKPQLVIVDKSGKESTVSSPSVITDKTGKATTIDKLTVGEKVKVIALAQGGSSVQVDG